MADRTVVREVIAAVRVAADPIALDAATWPAGATALRLAPDEVLLVDALDVTAPEPHAIVFPDSGWVRFVLSPAEGAELLERSATWPPPSDGLAQGAIAGIAAKVVVSPDRWWVIVLAALADEFEERLAEVLG